MDKDEALRLALRLCDEAVPKFNWGASFLDANAIQLLNTVPAAIKKALGQPAQAPAYTADAFWEKDGRIGVALTIARPDGGVHLLQKTIDPPQPTQKPVTYRPTGWAAHRDQYAVPVLFSPYTGEPRDVRDVQSDPQGILVIPPGKVEMLAALPAQEPVALVIDGVLVKSALPEKYTGHLYTTSQQRPWVGLTDEDIDQGLLRSNYALQTAGAWRDGVEWATKQLMERNK